MNISTRQLTDAELWQSYEILSRDLQERKAAGEKFGRVRDRLADLLGVSFGQVNKLDNIQHHAIEPVVDAVRNGALSVSTANEIAKLDTGTAGSPRRQQRPEQHPSP
jgi:ParB family chromosome partitioning protein